MMKRKKNPTWRAKTNCFELHFQKIKKVFIQDLNFFQCNRNIEPKMFLNVNLNIFFFLGLSGKRAKNKIMNKNKYIQN